MATEKTKDQRIKTEYRKILKLFKGLPENKLKLVLPLIENAAFMVVTLRELQEKINDEGAIYEHRNGNGFMVIEEHPAQKSYNTMINRYNTIVLKLAEMLPEELPKSKLQAFIDGE